MKKYIAFAINGVSCNSGVATKEKAHAWAAKTLADRPQIASVYIAEVIETASRTTPTIETKPFEATPESMPQKLKGIVDATEEYLQRSA